MRVKGNAFPVDIEESQLVGHLKDAIRENPECGFPKSKLELFLAKKGDGTWLDRDGAEAVTLDEHGHPEGFTHMDPLLWINNPKNFGDNFEPNEGEIHVLVVVPEGATSEHDSLSLLREASDVTLIEVKEKLLKEYERQEKKESSERALKATSFGGKGKNQRFNKVGKGFDRKSNGGRKLGRFKGKFFNCDKFSHMKRDCPEQGDGGEDRSAGWLIDSSATAHMTPHRDDLFEYADMSADMFVTIADGKKIRVAGTGSVGLTGIDGKRIRMVEVLHIPGLDRRLLSVGKLAERGMSVEFQRKSWVIWNKSTAIASGKKIGKAYVLECQQDTAYYTEYSGVESRSVKLDEREVNGIYDTASTEDSVTIQVAKDGEDATLPDPAQQPTTDNPLESVGDTAEDSEMREAELNESSVQDLTNFQRVGNPAMTEEMVFHPEPERIRRVRESAILGDGLGGAEDSRMHSSEDSDNDDHFWPPSPKRPRYDEDNLLAEAVLAYAADVGEADDAPSTYQQAMRSNESSE
ncbi:Integrase, catalytic core protein [Phytophthora cinnamomi]|uniref:Integrase, catalytic core protein n=1 Tax=Phytophthora cinnamomi TaxID=4785 RepID=UPI0035598D76|nr:Integrase, catalytic core protein [Phytophthora cinnamomi]